MISGYCDHLSGYLPWLVGEPGKPGVVGKIGLVTAGLDDGIPVATVFCVGPIMGGGSWLVALS